MTLSELQTYRAALIQAIAKGEKTVTYEGRSVTMRDVSEIKAALGVIDAEIAAATSAGAGSSSFVVATDMD